MAKKSFMTGYNFGHNVLGPAIGKIKAMESDDDESGIKVDKDYILIMDKMNNLLDFQMKSIASHNMPGLDDLLGESFQGGPPGSILKKITTKHVLSDITGSTSGLIVYNVDKMGRLIKAQFTGSANNVAQLNTYASLSEARQPQSGDYFVAANLVAQDNSDGNADTGVFTAGYKGLRDKTTNVATKLYNDFESPAADIAQTVYSRTIPFNGRTAVSVCTPNAFLIEHEEPDTISNFTNSSVGGGLGAAADPKARMGLCIAYDGLKATGDATRIVITLHEYYLSVPSPDMHQVSSHSTPKHHIEEIMALTFNPVNIL